MPPPDHSDDKTIPDQEFLWRLVDPGRIKWDEDKEGYRPISGVFRDGDQEMSVNIASLTNIQETLKGAGGPYYSIAQFQTALIRSFNCFIVRAPEKNNPSHALVCPKMTKTQAKVLSNECVWVHLDLTLVKDAQL